jgi:serine phosphatase RsbU (regulator of sigma subunit)/anti-sigma regulatory factor (Ser/Thr protein kinase)
MKSKEKALKRIEVGRQPDEVKKWSGLQARMTLSFVVASVATMLLLELLFIVGFFVVSSLATVAPFLKDYSLSAAKQDAQLYALEAAGLAKGDALDPGTTFQPGQPASIILSAQDHSGAPSYIDPHSASQSSSQGDVFVLLITPGGHVLASSYPARYPVSAPVDQVLPNQRTLIRNALAGRSAGVLESTAQGNLAIAVQTVWNGNRQPIGAVYVQTLTGGPAGSIFGMIAGAGGVWLGTALFWLIIAAPVGGLFGIITTRSLVRRIRRLATTTTQFASGQYELRSPESGKDEVGQLERSFNHMADQLVESMEQRQVLIEQQARQEERARIEQEMRTAQNIQRSLLPKEVPNLAGWQLMPYYQPAWEVGGDFYDFLSFEDGRVGIVVGDVAGKGVPAALLMATTRTMLRTAAQETISPVKVLARVNDLLAADIPPGMFVTCFYALLDRASGRLCYANAGHDLPYRWHRGEVIELWATGMPLGMLPGSQYEEKEMTLEPGDGVLFYSDGLVEAHNQQRAMFGFPRLRELLKERPECTAGRELINFLLGELANFTGKNWEQEDDVTLVALYRVALSAADAKPEEEDVWHLLSEWTVPSVPGNERQAMDLVEEAVQPLHLSDERLANLKTAVAEATMNAMEHGNHYQPDKAVGVQVLTSETAIAVRIQDQGENPVRIPIAEPATPDLEAKLAGQETPRGWGLFLIKNLVDEMHIRQDESHHIIELIMQREGVRDDEQKG